MLLFPVVVVVFSAAADDDDNVDCTSTESKVRESKQQVYVCLLEQP